MSVRFDLLTENITEMGIASAERQLLSDQLIDELLEKLKAHADKFDQINHTLAKVQSDFDHLMPRYTAAAPLFETERLDTGIPAPPPPSQATIIGVDGSQAIQTRHFAYPYYLINTGHITYYHGGNRPPTEASTPTLHYLSDEHPDGTSCTKSRDIEASAVYLERDQQELKTLARASFDARFESAPIVAIMDQKLDYGPRRRDGSDDQNQAVILERIEELSVIQRSNAIPVGYIERPQMTRLIRLLYTLDYGTPDFRVEMLERGLPLPDIALYRKILNAGERSPVFRIITGNPLYNQTYASLNQEICFFYYRPPNGGDVCSIDIPLWAAQQPEVLDNVHSLIHDQCLLLGNYPYVLTRADEVAVVQYADQEYLDHLIDSEMAKHGIFGSKTGKQLSKDASGRGSKQTHSL